MIEDGEARALRRGNLSLRLSAQEWVVVILILYAGWVLSRVLLDSLRPGSHFFYSANFVLAPATSRSYQRIAYAGIGHVIIHMVVGAVIGLIILIEKRNFSLRRILAACMLVGAAGTFGVISRNLTTTVGIFTVRFEKPLSDKQFKSLKKQLLLEAPDDELSKSVLEASRPLKQISNCKPKFFGDIPGESVHIRLYPGFFESFEQRISTCKEYGAFFEAVVIEFAKEQGLEPVEDANRRFLVEPYSTPEH